MNLSAIQVSDLLTVAFATQTLVAPQEADLARLGGPRGRLVEVRADLLARRSFVIAGVLAVLINAVRAERERVHPVVRRRGMQANERIRVPPMTARARLAVDHRHLDIRLGHQRVSERESAGTRAYDQIIRLD